MFSKGLPAETLGRAIWVRNLILSQFQSSNFGFPKHVEVSGDVRSTGRAKDCWVTRGPVVLQQSHAGCPTVTPVAHVSNEKQKGPFSCPHKNKHAYFDSSGPFVSDEFELSGYQNL